MKLGYRLYIFISAIIFNFYQATRVSLFQNEDYQQSSQKMENNGEHERQH